MSLFRDEAPTVGVVTFDYQKPAVSVGSGGTASGAQVGAMWFDVGQSFQIVSAFGQGGLEAMIPLGSTLGFNNVVTATNPSGTAQTLMSFVFPAVAAPQSPNVGGSLDTLGRALYLFGSGTYNTASGQTPTITIAVTGNDGTNTRTLLTWTSGATTASASNMPWNFDAYLYTTTTGSSGTFYGHGTYNQTLGTTASAATASYLDTNHANSSTLNLTQPITIAVTALMSSSNAGNSVLEDTLILEVMN